MIGLIRHCRKHTMVIIKKSPEILPANIKIIYLAMHKNKLHKKTNIVNSSKRISLATCQIGKLRIITLLTLNCKKMRIIFPL
jgi:hypothetical protein